jgi:hypothetical protein
MSAGPLNPDGQDLAAWRVAGLDVAVADHIEP